MVLSFNVEFDAAYGQPVEVSPDVARLTARNPGPFTFHGTNSYIIGRDTLAIIDPGPDDDEHFDALKHAIAGRPVSHIFITHTHRDHSPLARRLQQLTGAVTVAEGIHRPARPLRIGETNPLDASGDLEFSPDITIPDGGIVQGGGWAVQAIHTPGHAANHCAFALEGTGVLFSGDHVMAWSTSIIAPPDGSLADYMRSLDRLAARNDTRYLPGHGGAVDDPAAFVSGLRKHRMGREKSILARLAAGDTTIPEIVAAVYKDVNPQLHAAAGLSVLAHLEDLTARGVAASDGEIAIDSRFRLA